MNCPKCGEVCCCSEEPLPSENLELGPEPAEDAAQLVHTGAESENDGVAWRDELSARLNRYRARRKAPPPRYPSLRLPFETLGVRSRVEERRIESFEPVSNQALALDGAAHDTARMEELATIQPERVSEPARPTPVTQTSAKIIEFPRFAWAPPAPPPDQLGEPVLDKPRILDVPDVAPPPPALGGITIEPAPVPEFEKRPGIDIPLQSAPMGRRMAAAFVDGLLISGATALFGYIFWKITAVRPPQFQLVELAGGMLFAFWAAYQYLLMVYSASTPGLRAAGLELAHFDGTATSRALRRWRVLASYLSAVSIGMGYAWVFLDEDELCWHDRITHTYLAPRKPKDLR